MILEQARMDRRTLERLAIALAVATITWNVAEGIVALAAGSEAGSIALIGFGLDSFVEVFAAGVVLWRMLPRHQSAETAERRAVMLIGASFLLLAAYVGIQALVTLISASEPDGSRVGIVLAAVSLLAMPALAVAKRRTAMALSSHSLRAESTQTLICSLLSAILLTGLALNSAWGLWWADPLAALAMTPVIAREGWLSIAKKDVCC